MATSKTRPSRQEPERTGPNRTTGGGGHGSQSAGGAGTARPAASHREVIDRAVKLAYGVVDDHIVQGQRAAERLRTGSYSSADFDQDLRMCLDRALRLSKEWGVVGADLFDALRRMAGSRMGPGPSASDVALEMKTKRRAVVKFDIRPGMSRFNPLVPPLHSADRTKEPLKDVHFEFRDGSRPVLVVNIPDDHPHGVYHGAIIDSKTHEPGGFISVRVLQEDNR
jgi:hypothetical protein